MINTFGSIKEVFSASFDEINSIHGISDSVSNSIFEWYSNDENKKLIKNLENIGLKISEKLQSNSGNLNGKTFVLTGTLNNLTRQQATKIIESLWKIIFSDGSSDMYEANFMRRLTGLIYLDNKVVGDIKEKIKRNLNKWHIWLMINVSSVN